MKLLLDTHILLWWLAADVRLPARALEAIADPTNMAVISAATLWEVSIKTMIGRLSIEEPLPDAVVAQGFGVLPVSAMHAWAQRELPLHHRDPFDRLLIVQARAEGLTLVSVDDVFRKYDVALLALA